MTDLTDPQQTFALALRSPDLVGVKDKAGWLALFHPEAFVEDPVEAGRYRGAAQISLFWDVFIGPQPSVGFDVKRYFADVDEFNGTRVLPTGRLTIGYAF